LTSFPAPETGFCKKETGLGADRPFFTPEGRDKVWQSYSAKFGPEVLYELGKNARAGILRAADLLKKRGADRAGWIRIGDFFKE